MIFRLLRALVRLDIYDLNFVYGSEALGLLSQTPPTGLPRPGVIVRIGSFIWHGLASLGRLRRWAGRPAPNRIVFCFASRNQKNSLAPIAGRLPNARWVSVDLHGRLDPREAEQFPVFYAYLLACPFFPLVLLKFWQAQGYRRQTFRYAFDLYWLAYGCYAAAWLWLRRLAPAGLVVAGDHGIVERSLVRAAQAENIPSFYVQHASVSDKFPPLAFDYALLEGRDALAKYEQAGGASATRVLLTGMPKADIYFPCPNTHPTLRSVGIATNDNDPRPRVEQLCARLRSEFPGLVRILRPHPGDKCLALWTELARKYAMDLSDPETEISFDFLRRVDVLMAGDSSILLEAALMNVFPLYYDFAQTHLDWFGFERNGLADYVSEPQEACDRLHRLAHHRPPVRARARLYCATVGTAYDGRSAELASDAIERLAAGQPLDPGRWKRIPGLALEAYELCETAESHSND